MSGEKRGTNQNSRPRGLDLLRQVYDELYNELGEDYSPIQLLQAAQTLIDVTDEEYVNENYQEVQNYSGYFSHDVYLMLARKAWWVLENEHSNDGLGDERLGMDFEAPALLRVHLKQDQYVHRG